MKSGRCCSTFSAAEFFFFLRGVFLGDVGSEFGLIIEIHKEPKMFFFTVWTGRVSGSHQHPGGFRTIVEGDAAFGGCSSWWK